VLGYELRPGSAFRLSAVNEAGFRGPEPGLAKPSGVRRIAAIGDSATFGFGCPEEAAWPRQLEERLARADEPVQVLNLGVSGYGISQVVERLRVSGLPYQPDAVIYAYLLNDVESFSMQAAALRSLEERRGRGLGRWLAGSRLYRLVHVLVSGPPADPEAANVPPIVRARRGGIPPEEYYRALYASPEARQILADGMAELARSTQDGGALVLIFPVYDRNDGSTLSLPGVHALVAEQARAHGIEAIDLGPVYQAAVERGEDLFLDALHPNPRGHALAARIVSESPWLRRWMGMAPAPSLSR